MFVKSIQRKQQPNVMGNQSLFTPKPSDNTEFNQEYNMDESVRNKMDVTEYTPDNPLYLLNKISHDDLLKLEEEFKKTTVEIGLSKDNFIEIVTKIRGNGEL